MQRRKFLKSTVTGMALIAGNGLKTLGESPAQGPAMGAVPSASKVGRPVSVVSIGFGAGTPLSEIASRIDKEGVRHPDIVLLPELCRGQNAASMEPLDGATITAMGALAKRHSIWIAAPIDRIDGDRRFNTVVLLDRLGKIACMYDKLFPYLPECELQPPVTPGANVQVFDTDFGRVGFATCFDINYPEVWKRLEERGAELVLWPSAYSGGAMLQSYAINHHYYIVSSTIIGDASAYDITGERLLYEKTKGINVSRITLDLDRGIYYRNFNIDKRNKLLREHSQDVVLEKSFEEEAWFVLRAARPGVSARELAGQYEMEELRHYIARSQTEINKRRGWEFSERPISLGPDLS